ncbi:hypothetical protein MRB53_010910 [Persea americana]|uniref:Uncharacterized protein n=1 Tax=Persea americana TaxID=3435 RepID=A0ACC2LTX0_PERAE|nr:hypothetical protein MRB53_010910 [Persea americana]
MVAGSVSNEVLSQVAPERLWEAIVKDSPNLMPKLLPELVSSIVILEGDGGVGTIRQSNFTSDSLPTEEVTKEIMGGMTGMFKAIEGYLLANPGAYA